MKRVVLIAALLFALFPVDHGLAQEQEVAQLDPHATTLYLRDPQALFMVFEPGIIPPEDVIRTLAARELCGFLESGPPMDIKYPLPYKVKQWVPIDPSTFYAQEVMGHGGQIDAPTCEPKKHFQPEHKPKKREPGTEA